MYRRTRAILALACLAGALGLAPAGRADDVAAFLRRHDLPELLALHLEQKLENDELEADERERLIMQLADLYADLLQSLEDPDRRHAIETRSRRLLVQAPESSAEQLRLALAAGAYRGAERIAENHRLRLASDEEVEAARETLSETILTLQQTRQRLDDRMQLAQRRLSRTTGGRAATYSEDLERLEQLDARATYLAAWALYYQSFLNDRPDNARVAEPLFADVLGIETAHEDPANISIDRRGFEAFARSILGMALCKSLTGRSSTALDWLDLLEHESSVTVLREQLPAWRLVVLLEHGAFIDARQLLDQIATERSSVPVPWLRLVAAHALEAAAADRHAAELARAAVTRLASQQELTQVLDLAERYGMESLGESGFALRYVSGVLRYHEAREAHGDEEPTLDPDHRRRYEAARADFVAALEEDDAATYPASGVDARRLLAWCLYFEARFLDARDAFIEAEAVAGADDGPDLLWMAIVSLDHVVQAADNQALEDELARLTRRFLERYPSSVHAPRLVLRRALASGEATPELVQQLLSVPPNSDVALAARRSAARMLYRLFRERSGAERTAFANQYLDVAVPLFAAEIDELDPGDAAAVARVTVRGRRILEVALLEDVQRRVAARLALDAFDGMAEDGPYDLGEIEAELTYRRLRLRLYEDDVSQAEALAETLWTEEDPTTWERLAARALFGHAVAAWRGESGSALDVRLAQDMVVRHGMRIVREYEDDPAALEDSNVLSYFATVADAAMQVWERSDLQDQGRIALELYRRLLVARPRNARFLRAAGLLAERLDSAEFALECWRTLVAGTADYSEPWFEAKYHLLALLSQIDPARAREVMEQHRQLNPDYGPEPWSTRLRLLDERLRREESPGSSEPSS